MRKEKLNTIRIEEFPQNEFDTFEIKSQISELDQTRNILKGLLENLTQNTLNDFFDQTVSLVNDLNSDARESLRYQSRIEFDKVYYAVHFEAIELNSSNKDFDKTIIYIGLGLDLDMQRKILGYWIKTNSENTYDFWLRVCKELKRSGISSIHIKSLDNIYWLTKAMNVVFS